MPSSVCQALLHEYLYPPYESLLKEAGPFAALLGFGKPLGSRKRELKPSEAGEGRRLVPDQGYCIHISWNLNSLYLQELFVLVFI